MTDSMRRRRVAVTGMGSISALGRDPDELWEALMAGRSGISRLEDQQMSGFPTRIAGQVCDFPEERYFERKESRHWDRYIKFGVYAALQAWESAGLSMTGELAERTGVFLGTGIGGIQTLSAAQENLILKESRRTTPFLIPMMISNMGAGVVSMVLGSRGPCLAHVSACATGNNAIGEAFLAVREGRADVMIAGGAEAPLNPLALAGFCSMHAMSTRNDDPQSASAPFDAERDGFVLSEGAGVLVLEEWEHASARGAPILAEITGYGTSADSYHISSPDPEGRGAEAAMRIAAQMSGWRPEEVDYINAHATGTPLGDAAETRAIKRFMEGRTENLLVSSTKSATGHLCGAAGGLEAVIVVQALRSARVPPTLNLRHPDPACDLDYVPLVARERAILRVLSNGFGFGGHNAVVAFLKAG